MKFISYNVLFFGVMIFFSAVGIYGITPDEQLLLAAASAGKLDKVSKLLLSRGVDINVRDATGRTPLHWAAYNGREKTVRFLLSENANIGIRDNSNLTPRELTPGNYVKILKALDDKSKKVNEKLLDAAVLGKDVRAIEQALAAGADVNARSIDGVTALQRAAFYGNEEMAKLLIKNGADVNAKDNKGNTPLHDAIVSGNYKVAKLLLSHGADASDQLRAISDSEKEELIRLIRKELGIYGTSPEALVSISSGMMRGIPKKLRSFIVRFLVESMATPNSRLLYAAMVGDRLGVKEALVAGANVNVQDLLGRTALHYAQEHGDKDLVELLEKYKADKYIQDIHGFSAVSLSTPSNRLLYAALCNDVESVQRALLDGGGVNARDVLGRTALHYFAYHGNTGGIALLIKYGADRSILDSEGNSAAAFARSFLTTYRRDLMRRGMPKEAIDQALAAREELVYQVMSPQQLLFLGSQRGDKNLIERALVGGASVQARGDYHKTPLHYAILARNPEVVQLLLDKGAEVDVQDNQGKTPLHWAINDGYKGLSELLLDNGANVNSRDYGGETPLHVAARQGFSNVVKLLLERGAEVNAQDRDDRTPLYLAADKDKELSELLLDSGADVNSCTIMFKETPLHRAVYSKNEAVVRLLLNRGADSNVQNFGGKTPLHALVFRPAAAYTPPDIAVVQAIAELLFQHGANVNVRDKENKTPVQLAIDEGNFELASYLMLLAEPSSSNPKKRKYVDIFDILAL